MYIIYDLLFFLFWQNKCRFKLWVTQANACWTTRQNHRSMMRAEQCTVCCASTHHAAQNVYHLLRWKRLTEIHWEKLADIQKKLESFHMFQNMIPYHFICQSSFFFLKGALWVAFRKKRQDLSVQLLSALLGLEVGVITFGNLSQRGSCHSWWSSLPGFCDCPFKKVPFLM